MEFNLQEAPGLDSRQLRRLAPHGDLNIHHNSPPLPLSSKRTIRIRRTRPSRMSGAETFLARWSTNSSRNPSILTLGRHRLAMRLQYRFNSERLHDAFRSRSAALTARLPSTDRPRYPQIGLRAWLRIIRLTRDLTKDVRAEFRQLRSPP